MARPPRPSVTGPRRSTRAERSSTPVLAASTRYDGSFSSIRRRPTISVASTFAAALTMVSRISSRRERSAIARWMIASCSRSWRNDSSASFRVVTSRAMA